MRRPFKRWQRALALHIAQTAHAYFPIRTLVSPSALEAFQKPDDIFVVGLEVRCTASFERLCADSVI